MLRQIPRWKWALLILVSVLFLAAAGDLLWLTRARQPLPVLMYHHFDQTSTASTVVSEARFREQIAAMRNAGYTAVAVRQVIDFVDHGAPLPDKPVLITMDDGYTSNLDIAAPILEEAGMCATVFVIGAYAGLDAVVYPDGSTSPAHFAYEDAMPWVEKGVLDLQSHTYGMHELAYFSATGRDGVLPLEGETPEAHQQALREDMDLFRRQRGEWDPTPLVALSYPYGYWDREADQVMEREGIVLTVTTSRRFNRLTVGDPDCLRIMGRLNVTERWTGKKLVSWLDRHF